MVLNTLESLLEESVCEWLKDLANDDAAEQIMEFIKQHPELAKELSEKFHSIKLDHVAGVINQAALFNGIQTIETNDVNNKNEDTGN